MTLEEYNAGLKKFLPVYLRGLDEKTSCELLKITRSHWATYSSCVSTDQRLRRRNAMKIKAESQRALRPKPVITRSQILSEIASLLQCNGVYASMKSYEHCSNAKLLEVRDRLRRNRSDKYQVS